MLFVINLLTFGQTMEVKKKLHHTHTHKQIWSTITNKNEVRPQKPNKKQVDNERVPAAIVCGWLVLEFPFRIGVGYFMCKIHECRYYGSKSLTISKSMGYYCCACNRINMKFFLKMKIQKFSSCFSFKSKRRKKKAGRIENEKKLLCSQAIIGQSS